MEHPEPPHLEHPYSDDSQKEEAHYEQEGSTVKRVDPLRAGITLVQLHNGQDVGSTVSVIGEVLQYLGDVILSVVRGIRGKSISHRLDVILSYVQQGIAVGIIRRIIFRT